MGCGSRRVGSACTRHRRRVRIETLQGWTSPPTCVALHPGSRSSGARWICTQRGDEKAPLTRDELDRLEASQAG